LTIHESNLPGIIIIMIFLSELFNLEQKNFIFKH